MVSIQQVENVLKEVYLAVLSEQINNFHPFLSKIKRRTNNVYGKQILYANTMNGKVLKLNLANLYYTIQISDKAIRCSQGSAGAFVNLLNSEMESLIKNSHYDILNQLFGDGTGVLSNIKSINEEGKLFVDKIQYLYPGMKIKIFDDLDNELFTTYIFDINYSEKWVKVREGKFKVFPNYKIKRFNGSEDNLFGLEYIFGAPEVYEAGARDVFTTPIIQKVKIDDIINEIITSKDMNDSDFIICSHNTKRIILEKLEKSRRFIEVKELDGGYKALCIEGIPIIPEKRLDDNIIYILNSKEFEISELCDWSWLEGYEGGILKQVQGKPEYEATLVKYCNLLCKDISKQVKLILEE